VMFRAAYPPALWVNWHLAHCLKHGEDVDEAYRHIKGRIAHVHFSLGEDKGEWAGIVRQAQLLAAEGCAGYFSVEVINPPDPAEVLRKHAAGWRELCEAVGAGR
jgi:sugar phosphate isomerase/epimerase